MPSIVFIIITLPSFLQSRTATFLSFETPLFPYSPDPVYHQIPWLIPPYISISTAAMLKARPQHHIYIYFCHCLWTHLPSHTALFHPITTIWIIFKHYPHIIHGPRTQVPSKYFSFKTTSCYFSVNSMPVICFIWIHLLIGST